MGQPLRRAHDRAAAAARVLLRLGAHVHELGPAHVPLVAVAVPDAARRRPDLPRHEQRRLVRQLPHDARLDAGRAGRHLLALPRAGAPDPAAAVVPAHQRVRAGERPARGGARRERHLGRRRARLAGDRARAHRRRRARHAGGRRLDADGLHAPRRRRRRGALRADVGAPPRRRGLDLGRRRARAARAPALGRLGAQLTRGGDDPRDRHRPRRQRPRRGRAAGARLPARRLALRADRRARRAHARPHRRGDRAPARLRAAR